MSVPRAIKMARAEVAEAEVAVAEADEALREARRSLDVDLAAGRDTSMARRVLCQAERVQCVRACTLELVHIHLETQEALQDARRAEALLDDLKRRVRIACSAIPPPGAIHVAPELDEIYLLDLAQCVAEAERAKVDAVARHKHATAEVRKFSARLGKLRAEREDLERKRRQRGESSLPDDKLGAKLALLEADILSLTILIKTARADADAFSPVRSVDAHKLALEALRHAESEAIFAATRTYVKRLEAALVDAVGVLHEHGRKLGLNDQHPSDSWKPSIDLQRLVR